jgi:4-amino-4-deoxy-L-arabinose transferase-like glycosyltransferase
MNFFEPQVFNLNSANGKAACEFPILYYLTALLYKIFGEHEFILRLINLSIVSLGFYFLFRLLNILLRDVVFAVIFTILFFSSTVLIFYANNYLPDAPALGLSLSGWYFFYIFFKDRKNKLALVVSISFFTLGSLIKVTYFINPLATFLTIIVFDLTEKKRLPFIIKSNATILVGLSFSLLNVLSWNIYVTYYNRINNDFYFLIHIRPFWNLNKDEIDNVWEHISNYWYSAYYYKNTFRLFALLIIAGIFTIKKSDRKVLIPAILIVVGAMCYFFLFYAQFKYHDYYMLAMLPATILLIISSFLALFNRFPRLINNYIIKSGLMVLCVLSLIHAKHNLEQRYVNHVDDKNDLIGEKLSETRDYLRTIGVKEDDKIIIVTDRTPNGGLYFLNHSGWNVEDTSGNSIRFLEKYVDNGADYIILTDENYLNNIDISKFFGEKIGEHKEVLIYRPKKEM